jgi:hypothetical protein
MAIHLTPSGEFLSCYIERFDGQRIEGSRSKRSGVFAAFDWEDLVLRASLPIIGKATSVFEKGRLNDFPEEDHRALTRKLGHYSKVQSINSEDTVTWSVLGAYTLDQWIPYVLDLAFGPTHRPVPNFWARARVMDTRPESDVTLQQDYWKYEIESKWLQDIGKGQGQQRDLTQLDLRASCAQIPAQAWQVGRFGNRISTASLPLCRKIRQCVPAIL